MNILKYEFWNFIKNIINSGIELSDYEKRIIYIVFNNFDNILNTNNRFRWEKNRWTFIKKEILDNIDNKVFILPNIDDIKPNSDLLEKDIVLLKELKVSYFRWFREEVIFNFNKRFNLLYWYNWTWKSSFSESLEYQLTWYIREAIHRWYKNSINKYISHIHSNWSSLIKLIDYNWNELESDIDKYRYSFIEKSRIDDFVKFKNDWANDSIQNLFWFWEFNKFIFEFTNDIKLVNLNEEEISLLSERDYISKDIKGLKIQVNNWLLTLKKTFIEDNLNIEEKENINDYIEQFDIILEKKKESISSLNKKRLLEKNKIDTTIQNISDKNKKIPLIRLWLSLLIFVLSILIYYLLNDFYFLLMNLIIIPVFYFIKEESIKYLEDKINDIWLEVDITFLDRINTKVIEFKKDYESFILKESKLKDFLEKNKDKILKAEENQKRKGELENYEKWYRSFYKRLINYKDIISEWIIKDELEKYTIEIFNKLSYSRNNRNYLKSIKIPKRDWENLLVIDELWNEINTLKIFSEWNLRCLWISILLSKTIINNQNFIICDDIVNSLDFEFRKSIIDLFKEYEPFKNKQFIITTHSEKFLNLFLNKINNKDFHEYRLIQNWSKKIVSIKNKSDLLTIIEKHLQKWNIIDWLSKSRILLEVVLSKISNKYIKTTVSVKCFNNFNINTYQKINSLYWYFKKEPNQEILNLLDIFKNNSIYYKYLNSSSHDDSSLEDISLSESMEIYETLVKLNSL